MNIKAILIDDESSSIETLQWLITTYCPEVSVLATFNSAEDAIKTITKYNPDVVFLDIEMPKMNGFEFLEKMKPLTFDVVFTTAYDNFAVKAFKYAAINYLLKPVDPVDLQSTIERIKLKSTVPSKDQLDLLFQNLGGAKDNTISRIALSVGDGLVFCNTQDIAYCQAESNYTNVVLVDGKKHLVAKTLKELDETLSGKDFFRVHNSYLININHIIKLVKGDGGYILMPDGAQITISRTRRDDFFKQFAKF